MCLLTNLRALSSACRRCCIWFDPWSICSCTHFDNMGIRTKCFDRLVAIISASSTLYLVSSSRSSPLLHASEGSGSISIPRISIHPNQGKARGVCQWEKDNLLDLWYVPIGWTFRYLDQAFGVNIWGREYNWWSHHCKQATEEASPKQSVEEEK